MKRFKNIYAINLNINPKGGKSLRKLIKPVKDIGGGGEGNPSLCISKLCVYASDNPQTERNFIKGDQLHKYSPDLRDKEKPPSLAVVLQQTE